jgi:hypothetical protein
MPPRRARVKAEPKAEPEEGAAGPVLDASEAAPGGAAPSAAPAAAPARPAARRPDLAAAAAAAAAAAGEPPLTAYELQRAAIIARNRVRLEEMGILESVKNLKALVAPAAPAPAAAAKRPAAKRARVKAEVTAEEKGGEGGGPRRSRRIEGAAARPRRETTAQRAERELGEFLASGDCPRCGRAFESRHAAHLAACAGGPKAKREPVDGGRARADKALLSQLSEKDKKDERKRMLARMSALSMDHLVEFDDDSAKFVVLGSKGDPYTVALQDGKHTCTCLDHRFRRHDCKHILLVLRQLGKLDAPADWRAGVEARLGELAAGPAPAAHPTAPPPRDVAAELAMRLL